MPIALIQSFYYRGQVEEVYLFSSLHRLLDTVLPPLVLVSQVYQCISWQTQILLHPRHIRLLVQYLCFFQALNIPFRVVWKKMEHISRINLPVYSNYIYRFFSIHRVKPGLSVFLGKCLKRVNDIWLLIECQVKAKSLLKIRYASCTTTKC